MVRCCFAAEAVPRLCKVEQVQSWESGWLDGEKKMLDALPVQGTSNKLYKGLQEAHAWLLLR